MLTWPHLIVRRQCSSDKHYDGDRTCTGTLSQQDHRRNKSTLTCKMHLNALSSTLIKYYGRSWKYLTIGYWWYEITFVCIALDDKLILLDSEIRWAIGGGRNRVSHANENVEYLKTVTDSATVCMCIPCKFKSALTFYFGWLWTQDLKVIGILTQRHISWNRLILFLVHFNQNKTANINTKNVQFIW